jgi:hypothetical protein
MAKHYSPSLQPTHGTVCHHAARPEIDRPSRRRAPVSCINFGWFVPLPGRSRMEFTRDSMVFFLNALDFLRY